VTEAKRQLFGVVGIDMLAGPSELVVLADRSAVPAYVAADLLSQAEHDEDAYVALVTDSEALSRGVEREHSSADRRFRLGGLCAAPIPTGIQPPPGTCLTAPGPVSGLRPTVKALSDASGSRLDFTFGYDGAGRLSSVSSPAAGAFTYGYADNSLLASRSHSARSVTISRDSLGRVIGRQTSVGGTTEANAIETRFGIRPRLFAEVAREMCAPLVGEGSGGAGRRNGRRGGGSHHRCARSSDWTGFPARDAGLCPRQPDT
jgi:hypothetical protein